MMQGNSCSISRYLIWILPCLIITLTSCNQSLKPNVKQDYHQVIVTPTSAKGFVSAMVILPNTPATTGLAHYTEHLVWLNAIGNKQRRANSHANAWTSSNSIRYWLTGDIDELESILTTLAEIFSPLDLPSNFAQEELDIVMREYDLRIAQNIDSEKNELADQFLYTGTHYADSLIGTPEQIQALDYHQAKALHATVYHPQNAVLYVSGDVTRTQVLEALDGIELPSTTASTLAFKPQNFKLAKIDQLVINYKTPALAPQLVWRKVLRLDQPIDFDILETHCIFLNDLLTTSLPGGLAGPLRFDAMVASEFDLTIFPHDEQHIEIIFAARPDENVRLSELKKIFENTLTASATNGIPSKTYDRIRKRFNRFWPDWSNFEETSDWIKEYQLERLSALRTPTNEKDLINLDQTITQQSTNALLKQLTNDGRVTIIYKNKD